MDYSNHVIMINPSGLAINAMFGLNPGKSCKLMLGFWFLESM